MTTPWTATLAIASACTILAAASPLAARAADARSGAAAAQATPDPARGRALLDANGCLDCHRIGDRGSRVGPDLSDIGARRTPERLEQALVDPDAEVLPEARSIRVVTKDGATVTGRLLNQDAVSVQLITDKELLKSYLRDTVRSATILDKGLMPSYLGRLTAPQIADLVAYLGSLKP